MSAESADPNKKKRDTAEERRQVVATVGKPGQPGEHVRCVVSVAMLTEGWDANNVTQILGVRAFPSQLKNHVRALPERAGLKMRIPVKEIISGAAGGRDLRAARWSRCCASRWSSASNSSG